jgi:hypothetical protein
MPKARSSTVAPAEEVFLSYDDLAARWGVAKKTIANHIVSGRLPLRAVQLWDRADPRFVLADVIAYEATRVTRAGRPSDPAPSAPTLEAAPPRGRRGKTRPTNAAEAA